MRGGVEKRVFIAATNQNDGKTTCSLGFVEGFRQYAKSVGFMKPVGQRYVTVDGHKVDEDSLLIQRICGLQYRPKDLNPIVIEPDFTRRFLDNPEEIYPRLEKALLDSFAVVAKGNDMVVIEGTGHAGVGSVFWLCNARVAKLLNAKVVIVTLGGIGRPVDEVAVNCSLFEKEGVPVLGVVVNKAMPEKVEQTRHYVGKALKRLGLDLLGVIPYAPRLAWPTICQVAESTGAEVLSGHARISNPVADIVIGAMTPHNAITYIHDGSLLIVPGDRDDVLLAMVSMHILSEGARLAGIILTGGLRPHSQTLDLLYRINVPLLLSDAGTYETASRIHSTVIKIRCTDQDKIQLATSLVRDNVDLEQLWRKL